MKKRYDDTQKKTGKYVEKVVKDILKKMDVATAADVKALKKEIQQLKRATGSTGVKKRAGRATAKKWPTAAAQKRGITAAKKRTVTTAKKTAKRSSATGAKKRTRRAGAKIG
jgi:predicted ATPase with chaperone activity